MKRLILLILIVLSGSTLGQYTSDYTGAEIDSVASVVFVPNQTTFAGTIFFGDGGSTLSNTGTQAGDFNTYIGIGSGFASTIAKKNTMLGYHAGYSLTSGWANTFVGYNAGATGIGTGSLDISGTGVEFYANTAVGESAMLSATTGSYNSALGTNSLTTLTTGQKNSGVGVHTLQSLTTGSSNTAMGYSALYLWTGDNAIGIGATTLFSKVTGGYPIAIGTQAGYNDVANGSNLYIGHQAGYYQKSGYYGTYIGFQAGYSSTDKSQYYNTVIGYKSGYSAGNNEGNTYVGYQSGYVKTTGDYNTFIGHNAGQPAGQLVTAGNSIAIGYGAYTNASNQIVLGNNTSTTLFTNAAVNYAADTSSTDAYKIVIAQIGAYVTGMTITFKTVTANTDGATLTINALSPIAILKHHDQALATGDIEAGQIVVVVYDGTSWQMTSQLAQ